MNSFSTGRMTFESLHETIRSLPKLPPPSVCVFKGPPEEVIAGLRKAGIQERPASDGLPFGPLDGLEIRGVPNAGITLIGTPSDIDRVLADPPSLLYAVKLAQGPFDGLRFSAPAISA